MESKKLTDRSTELTRILTLARQEMNASEFKNWCNFAVSEITGLFEKEEVKSAEILSADEMLTNHFLDDNWEPNYQNIVKIMDKFHSQFQSVQSKEVQLFMDDVHQWADSTFGTERTALAPLYHLKKEVDEAIEAMERKSPIYIIEELADCFILVLNSASKYGLQFSTLFIAAKNKMVKNKSRKWGKPDENGVCEHIKVQSVKGEGERTQLPESFKLLFKCLEDGCYEINFYGNDGNDNQEKVDGKEILIEWIKEAYFDAMESYKHSESKEQYPKEFIEFLCDYYQKFWNRYILLNGEHVDPFNTKQPFFTFEEVFNHWSTVVTKR